jgi:hypothetical protein
MCHYITSGTCGIYAMSNVKNIKKLPKLNLKQKQKLNQNQIVANPNSFLSPQTKP